MDDLQYKIITSQGDEVCLTEMDFKGKVAIITYDSNKVDQQAMAGLQTMIVSLQQNQGATGVYILDQNYDLKALAEEDLGVHPEFAKKFIDTICKKSAYRKTNEPPIVHKKIEEYKEFYEISATYRLDIYRRIFRSTFCLGWCCAILLFFAVSKNLWNLLGAAVFFAAYCNIEYRIKRGEYEQEASEKAGRSIKGRSYDPNDYL